MDITDPPRNLATLTNGLSADVSCQPGAEVNTTDVVWYLHAANGIGQVMIIGDQPPQFYSGTAVHVSRVDATTHDLAFSQNVPGMHVVAPDGTEIRIDNARAHFNVDHADCIAAGTVTKIGR